ncbi:hypothetical protein [Ligilactobacillus murinus]|uniref:hypothetical protein n=1 Tax=Ligilactobacillus murinus TaxID=1622 RepID=UPI00399D6294
MYDFLTAIPMLDVLSLLKNLLNWGLGIVLVFVGGWLILVALFDLKAGLGKTGDKDFKTAGIGILIGAVGALLLYMAAQTWIGILKGAGDNIPTS